MCRSSCTAGPPFAAGAARSSNRCRPFRRLHFVVVKPPVGLNTGEVYGAMSKLADSHDGRSSKLAADSRKSCTRYGPAVRATWPVDAKSVCSRPLVRCRLGSIGCGPRLVSWILSGISFRAVGLPILAFVAMRSTHGEWQIYFEHGNWDLSTPRAVVSRVARERKENRPWKSPRFASSSWKSLGND